MLGERPTEAQLDERERQLVDKFERFMKYLEDERAKGNMSDENYAAAAADLKTWVEIKMMLLLSEV
jgi:hypothetical protein